MATIGSMDQFVPEKETIECYVERLEQYLLANEIGNAGKKKATLLTVLGSTVYSVLRDLLSPESPSTKTYQELVETLKQHYSPKPLIIAERYRFWKRDQESGESVPTYIVILRKLASTCDFGVFLNDALRDRIVCGIRNDVCRRRLLCEDRLTLKRAVDMAQAMELAEKNSMELSCHGNKGSNASVSVNKLFTHKKGGDKSSKPSVSGKQEETCFRCGGKHSAKTCRYKKFKCHNCLKVGHLAKKCRSAKTESTHLVGDQEDQAELEEFELYGVYATASPGANGYMQTLLVEGKPLKMEIDTGAVVSVASEKFYEGFLQHLSLQPSSRKLKSYSGDPIEVKGEVMVHVAYQTEEFDLPLTIVQGTKPALLGRNWLSHMKLDWPRIIGTSRHVENHPNW